MRALVLCVALAATPVVATATDDTDTDTSTDDTDTGTADTDEADLSGLAASEVAGEEGGMRCDVASAQPAGWLVLGLGLLVTARRRRS